MNTRIRCFLRIFLDKNKKGKNVEVTHIFWNKISINKKTISLKNRYRKKKTDSKIPYISMHKLLVRFSFENLYISRIGEKKNLAKCEKNEILPSGKKKFSILTYRQSSKNVPNLSPLPMTSQWVLNEPAPSQCYLLPCQPHELSQAC